jgi:hypothetical protein
MPMPNNPDRAVEDRLTALAARLDEAIPPLAAADVITRRLQPTPLRRHPAVVVGVAALTVAAAVAGFVVIVGDDESARVDTTGRPSPGQTTETTAPADPARGTLPWGPPSRETPPLLLVWDNTEMALIDYSGRELARAAMDGWHTNRPDVGIDLNPGGRGVRPADAVAIDDPIPGCSATHGRGGIVAAACGGPGGEGPPEIRVVATDGRARRLTGARPGVGHWRHAVPSPDGKWVLGQWSGECEAPTAFLINVATGRVDDVAPAAVDSYGIGWAPGGRAIVGIGAGPCADKGFTDTGTFLVDPNRKVRTRIHPFFAGTMVRWERGIIAWNRLERRVDRAFEELGLEGGGEESSHGGEQSSSSAMFDGAAIFIKAVPGAQAGYLEPVGPDELRFRCGDDIYTLSEWEAKRPDRTRLERFAARLVSRLYCVRRPA